MVLLSIVMVLLSMAVLLALSWGITHPGWSGPFTFTGTMNAGGNPIIIFDAGVQNVSITGGTITATGIAVMTLA